MALQNERILLREERETDLPFLIDLRNDLDTQGWSRALPPDYNMPMYRKRYENREFSYDRRDGRFTIEMRETGDIAGMIVFSGMEPRMSAVIGIAVAKKFWGTGVAYEAQELLLHFLFHEMGLRVVRLYTQSGLKAAIGLAEKSGFRISLRQRESVFIRGNLYDSITMDILREEYYARHPELTDHLPNVEEPV
jgi:RimJ/RimL family protein N-acetyltransferase